MTVVTVVYLPILNEPLRPLNLEELRALGGYHVDPIHSEAKHLVSRLARGRRETRLFRVDSLAPPARIVSEGSGALKQRSVLVIPPGGPGHQLLTELLTDRLHKASLKVVSCPARDAKSAGRSLILGLDDTA